MFAVKGLGAGPVEFGELLFGFGLTDVGIGGDDGGFRLKFFRFALAQFGGIKDIWARIMPFLTLER